MILNGTRQLLLCVDDINILEESVHIIKENTEAFMLSSKENGLEVDVDKTKYMVMCRDQNAGRSYNTKIDNNSFQKVEDFKYLGTTLTNQNSIQ